MDTWNASNLPENHELLENVQFVGLTEGTWKRKKDDGTDEVVPKWDYMTTPDEQGFNRAVSIYSSTDKESIQLNHPYDLIVKRAVGKDGTFYGYSLKGFGDAGKPIPKKEPQSRWQKGQRLNAKAEALKAASQTLAGSGASPEDVIEYAEVFEAWLNGEHSAKANTSDTQTNKS